MKAKLLLMIFLLTQTSLQQLWGAAALVDHYYEHNTGSQEMPLVDFLIRHYTEAHEQDGHPEKDHSMPFHHVDGSLQLGHYTPLDQRVQMDHVVLAVDQSRFKAHLKQSICAGETAQIWQPPRF